VSVFKITTLAFGVKTNWNGQCSSHAWVPHRATCPICIHTRDHIGNKRHIHNLQAQTWGWVKIFGTLWYDIWHVWHMDSHVFLCISVVNHRLLRWCRFKPVIWWIYPLGSELVRSWDLPCASCPCSRPWESWQTRVVKRCEKLSHLVMTNSLPWKIHHF
jgi:hypothetical protein